MYRQNVVSLYTYIAIAAPHAVHSYCHQMHYLSRKMHTNVSSAEAPPWTPVRELIVLPRL